MQVTPKRCKGCKCVKCRWRGAGSNCYYNEHGADISRCSYCQVYARGEELAAMKTESYLCKGYQRKYEEKEALLSIWHGSELVCFVHKITDFHWIL